jgi:hypothetical protein
VAADAVGAIVTNVEVVIAVVIVAIAVRVASKAGNQRFLNHADHALHEPKPAPLPDLSFENKFKERR